MIRIAVSSASAPSRRAVPMARHFLIMANRASARPAPTGLAGVDRARARRIGERTKGPCNRRCTPRQLPLRVLEICARGAGGGEARRALRPGIGLGASG